MSTLRHILSGPPYLLLALLSCFLPQHAAMADAAPPEDDLEEITLQLKWRHQWQFAGYYAAIEQGYYRDAGLRVTLREAVVGEEPADVVLEGRAEYGVATSDLVVLRDQGHPVVVLAPIFQHSPLVLLVAADSGIDNIHALQGQPVAIEPHSAELFAYFQAEGIPPDALDLRDHTFDPTPLIRGEVVAISAYSTDEPFLLQQAGVDYLTFNPRAGGIDFYGDTLFTTEAELDNHPRRVNRFLDASLKGWEYAMAHPEEIARLIREEYSQRHSLDHLLFEAEMSQRLILPDVVELGYINPGRWRHIAESYAALGLLPQGISLDGFLYERHPRQELGRLYLALVLVVLGGSILGALAFHFRRMHLLVHEQARVLEQTLQEIKVVRGILPICAHCKKIRDDAGAWKAIEEYISMHSDAQFSHGICEECQEEHYGEYFRSKKSPTPR